MAVELGRGLSLEEFLALPEEKPALELGLDGVVDQKLSPKWEHVAIQSELCLRLDSVLRPKKIGRAVAELRMTCGGVSFVPDVVVLRWDQIPRRADGRSGGDLLQPPHVAIEVVSPLQSINRLVAKALWYVENGVQVALVVDPDDESVAVYQAGAPPKVLHGEDVIPFGEFSEHVQLTVASLMATLAE